MNLYLVIFYFDPKIESEKPINPELVSSYNRVE